MRITTLFGIFTWTVLITASSGFCQERAEGIVLIDGHTISIDSAVTTAIENDPKTRQIRWQVDEAIGNRTQQTRRPNPTVGVIANELGNEGSAGQYGAYFSQNIIRSDRIAQNYQIHTLQIQHLQCGFELRQLRLARRVSLHFLLLAKNRQELGVFQEYLKSLEDIKTIVQKLITGGELAEFVLTGVELEMETQRQVIQQNERQFSNLKAQLAVMIGLAKTDSIEIEFDWADAVAAVSAEHDHNLVEQIAEKHPEVCQLNSLIDQSRWKVELARSQRCPDYQLQASLNYDSLSNDLFGALQIGVPLLINDRKSGLIRAAKANLNANSERLNVVTRNLRQNVVAEVGNQSVLKNQIANLDKTLMKLAISNDEKVRKAFGVGTVSYLQLKEAMQSVQNVKQMKIQLQYQLLVSQAKLETVTSD